MAGTRRTRGVPEKKDVPREVTSSCWRRAYHFLYPAEGSPLHNIAAPAARPSSSGALTASCISLFHQHDNIIIFHDQPRRPLLIVTVDLSEVLGDELYCLGP